MSRQRRSSSIVSVSSISAAVPVVSAPARARTASALRDHPGSGGPAWVMVGETVKPSASADAMRSSRRLLSSARELVPQVGGPRFLSLGREGVAECITGVDDVLVAAP